jgi:hypothetical protein
MKLALKSIKAEAAACRKAFKGFPNDGLVIHCHHELLFERLIQPAERRIDFIVADKLPAEIPLRLRLFRPVLEKDAKKFPVAYANYKKAYARRKKAHARRKKVWANYRKVEEERQKAYEKWNDTYVRHMCTDATCKKSDAKWKNERDKWMNAYAKWQKANAKWNKADAQWNKADDKLFNADRKLVYLLHPHICKNCPWNGHTIFPEK